MTNGNERRVAVRCPVCQGPATEKDGQVKCRTSICVHNHKNVICPRCQGKEIKHVFLNKDKLDYTCGDCENTWTQLRNETNLP
jgi:hypothetical protein